MVLFVACHIWQYEFLQAPHEPATIINSEQTDSTVFENIEQNADDEVVQPADENNHEHKPEPEPGIQSFPQVPSSIFWLTEFSCRKNTPSF